MAVITIVKSDVFEEIQHYCFPVITNLLIPMHASLTCSHYMSCDMHGPLLTVPMSLV